MMKIMGPISYYKLVKGKKAVGEEFDIDKSYLAPHPDPLPGRESETVGSFICTLMT